MTIRGIGRFLGVVGIGLVAVSTLGAGVSFAGELTFWFSCGAFFFVSTLGSPPVFTLGVLHVLGCAFLSCLSVGSLSLILLSLFGFTSGGVGVRQCDYD